MSQMDLGLHLKTVLSQRQGAGHCIGTEEQTGVSRVALFVVAPPKRAASPADQRPVKCAQNCGGSICPAGCLSVACGRSYFFRLGDHLALGVTPTGYSSNL